MRKPVLMFHRVRTQPPWLCVNGGLHAPSADGRQVGDPVASAAGLGSSAALPVGQPPMIEVGIHCETDRPGAVVATGTPGRYPNSSKAIVIHTQVSLSRDSSNIPRSSVIQRGSLATPSWSPGHATPSPARARLPAPTALHCGDGHFCPRLGGTRFPG